MGDTDVLGSSHKPGKRLVLIHSTLGRVSLTTGNEWLRAALPLRKCSPISV